MHWGEFNQMPAPKRRACWTRSIQTAIWYVPQQPESMFAEAEVLTIWLRPIFEPLPAFAVNQPIQFSGSTGRRQLADLRPGMAWALEIPIIKPKAPAANQVFNVTVLLSSDQVATGRHHGPRHRPCRRFRSGSMPSAAERALCERRWRGQPEPPPNEPFIGMNGLAHSSSAAARFMMIRLWTTARAIAVLHRAGYAPQ
jgi:hypothetical protein